MGKTFNEGFTKYSPIFCRLCLCKKLFKWFGERGFRNYQKPTFFQLVTFWKIGFFFNEILRKYFSNGLDYDYEFCRLIFWKGSEGSGKRNFELSGPYKLEFLRFNGNFFQYCFYQSLQNDRRQLSMTKKKEF